MRILWFLLQKEFKQIFRNTTILRVIIATPIIQLIILPQAADYEIKNINISVVDQDESTYSKRLIQELSASGYFKLSDKTESFEVAFKELELDKADLILEIPSGFERNLTREQTQPLYIAVNAINGTKANVGAAYLGRVIADFNSEIRTQMIPSSAFPAIPSIEISTMNWFNPTLNYDLFMVPGILVFLVTMVASYMCALNIVKEKEVGTIEQINVTPVSKVYFILGKLIPFLIISLLLFTFGLFIVAYFMYGVVSVGSLWLMYAYLVIYLIAVLGIGLLISTYANTQQQAMSLAFFFVMIFLLMSGLFTPIDSMPEWGKWIARVNPISYFIEVMRLIVLKGSGLAELKHQFLVMIGFALFFNTWAVLNYKKTS